MISRFLNPSMVGRILNRSGSQMVKKRSLSHIAENNNTQCCGCKCNPDQGSPNYDHWAPPATIMAMGLTHLYLEYFDEDHIEKKIERKEAKEQLRALKRAERAAKAERAAEADKAMKN